MENAKFALKSIFLVSGTALKNKNCILMKYTLESRIPCYFGKLTRSEAYETLNGGAVDGTVFTRV